MHASLQHRSNRTWVHSMLPAHMNETSKERLTKHGGFFYRRELFPRSIHEHHRIERDPYEKAEPERTNWSFPFNVSVPADAIPTFDMSFQSFSYRLIFRMQSVFVCDIDAESEDDEWEPRTLRHRSYHNLWTEIPIKVATEQSEEAAAIHYLDENAPAPYFVSVSELDKYKTLSSAQRSEQAPLAHPETKSTPRCAGRNHFRSNCFAWKDAYVGETWQKKMKKAEASSKAEYKFIFQTRK